MGFKSPKDTTCSVDNIGCNKVEMAFGPLLTLGFLAGAFIAFGGLLVVIVGGGVPGLRADNPGLGTIYFSSDEAGGRIHSPKSF
jgi:formate/nitrite transporter FocA (FNT family)